MCRTISNSGRIKFTCEVSAPESRKTTTRCPLSMSSPRVGQSDCATGTDGGTYARGVIPIKIDEIYEIVPKYATCTCSIKGRLPYSADVLSLGVCEQKRQDFIRVRVQECFDLL